MIDFKCLCHPGQLLSVEKVSITPPLQKSGAREEKLAADSSV
jgi:hypothetical protein